MKFKRVKVYQAVYLGKDLETMLPSRKNPKVSIDLIEGIGVKIANSSAAIIVPFPNVAYVELENEETKSKSNGKSKIQDSRGA